MRLLTISLLCGVYAANCASAQVLTGSNTISGIVSDPSGAGIPGADVQVRLRGTKEPAARAKTDHTGSFRMSGLPAGSFEIEVQRDGFAGQTLRVNVRDRPPAPLLIEMKLAGVRQTVTVTGSAAQVSTDSADNLDVVTMDREM